jgi:hypothetical protein
VAHDVQLISSFPVYQYGFGLITENILIEHNQPFSDIIIEWLVVQGEIMRNVTFQLLTVRSITYYLKQKIPCSWEDLYC